ncbi:hypothetical protein EMCRGX_G019942, partial [Ephydatia muelleri]
DFCLVPNTGWLPKLADRACTLQAGGSPSFALASESFRLAALQSGAPSFLVGVDMFSWSLHLMTSKSFAPRGLISSNCSDTSPTILFCNPCSRPRAVLDGAAASNTGAFHGSTENGQLG